MMQPKKPEGPASGVADQPPLHDGNEQKRRATLIAQLALARGLAVHEIVGGGFVVCNPSFAKHCRDLDELESFSRLVLGVQP